MGITILEIVTSIFTAGTLLFQILFGNKSYYAEVTLAEKKLKKAEFEKTAKPLAEKYDVIKEDIDIFETIIDMDKAERKEFFEFNDSKNVTIINLISIFLTLSSIVLAYVKGISQSLLVGILMIGIMSILISINLYIYRNITKKKRKRKIAFYRYCYLDTFNLKNRDQYFYEKS